MIPVELGTEKIGKLLKQYATPAIIAMLATSLYNMVDSIYIGQGVGPMAISGLAVTFPLMNISIAFGTLVGVGAATLISILLGQKDYKLANRVLGNVVILNVVISALVTALGLIFLNPILYFFGASDNTISYAREYMVVILWGNIISHLYHGLNGVVRSSGRPRLAMLATILAVVLNIILDPIFIFALKMGIRGAAIATVLAQVIALIWITRILCDKNNVLHFTPDVFKFDWKIAWRSLSIGMSPFLMNIASCFVVILINNQLKRYGGDLAIGAYGISNRLCFLFFTITMGLTQGMQPIAGYNYGARNWGRVKEVLRLTIFCGSDIGLPNRPCHTPVGRVAVYPRCRAPGNSRPCLPHHRADVSDCRVPSGGDQFLPMRRICPQGHIPLALTPAAVPGAFPGHISVGLGAGRRLVEYARLRPGVGGCGIHYATCADA